MKTHIQKWGNSLATRLPKSFAEELGLVDGSPINMALDDGAIVIKPDREREWNLDALLDGVTDENIHLAWEAEEAAGDGPGREGDER
jgi:antitoxin MazE